VSSKANTSKEAATIALESLFKDCGLHKNLSKNK